MKLKLKSSFIILFLIYDIDWESESVDKSEILRLIYQGRFLHCNVTLGKFSHKLRSFFLWWLNTLLFQFSLCYTCYKSKKKKKTYKMKQKTTLITGALGLPLGKTTVMHLVPRDNLPEPNSQGEFSMKISTNKDRFYMMINGSTI